MIKKTAQSKRANLRRKKRFTGLGLWIILILIVVALLAYFVNSNRTKATFDCNDSKKIKTVFHTGDNEYVELSLSDGRTMKLDVTASAGGARYSNKSESIVFWNTGNTARLEEDGKATFFDCIQK